MSEEIICKMCGREVIAYMSRKPTNGERQYYAYCPRCNKEGWISIELNPLVRTMELWGGLKGEKEKCRTSVIEKCIVRNAGKELS